MSNKKLLLNNYLIQNRNLIIFLVATLNTIQYVIQMKRKLESSVKQRYSSHVTYLDTNHAKVGIVENQFKDAYQGTGADISSYGIFFENIHGHLLKTMDSFYEKYGKEHVYLLGCVAWLSDNQIIAKMKECAGCIIIINDEKYSTKARSTTLQNLLQLPRITTHFRELFQFSPNKIMQTYDNKEDTIISLEPSERGNLGKFGPILTLGSRPLTSPETSMRENSSSSMTEHSSLFQGGPILHSKYLIFCVWYGKDHEFVPAAVWTGSINLTTKSRQNQENALLLRSIPVAKAFYEDFVNSFQAALPVRM
jgi:hypothetical protein